MKIKKLTYRLTWISLIYVFCLTLLSCTKQADQAAFDYLAYSKNSLNYIICPSQKFDKTGLSFSDQGAWFAYSFPDSAQFTGFAGPFLMTQQNGVWASKSLAFLDIKNQDWIAQKTTTYSSHLEQIFESKEVQLTQKLVFLSGHTAVIQSSIKNKSKQAITLHYQWKNHPILADSLQLSASNKTIKISSSKSDAVAYLRFPEAIEKCENNLFSTVSKSITLAPKEVKEVSISQSFIFPEYDWQIEKRQVISTDFDALLQKRKVEKDAELSALINNRKPFFQDSIYADLLAKTHLTLQNNWRIPAGEIAYEGLFPSYHYKWFNGFWSWDSWKHAVGLSYYHPRLAKEQLKVLFHFQETDGFVPDVVYRDTSIERHNYRDTKPPLAAWAVAKIYAQDQDISFVQEMYPRLKSYHYWWYNKRDHDQDSLCEYGSTDGTLIAAKWESGMDNAIRFDSAKIVKNSAGAYSMNQESVDLNAYLYAEKRFLRQLAQALDQKEDIKQWRRESQALKKKIQQQFYDETDGWFYDTNLEGTDFIKGEGSEGWTALWAKAATPEQAKGVKKRLLDPEKFYTKIPFQTMSADHPKFNPQNGYWRGPNWLDQSYFGVKGLRQYGFDTAADQAAKKILHGAEGLLQKGVAIRENYHPLTGKGLNAQNFSWSAAHIMMLLEQ